jgi:hypothetical protein
LRFINDGGRALAFIGAVTAGGCRMRTSTHYPPKSRTTAIERPHAVDWLAIWAMSLGFCALVLAGIAFFSIGDTVGASFILAAAAGIIGLVLHASAPPHA